MELRHLRYFVAVAEELSFGRAASRLAMAQPPLSRQIRALEDEIGVRLLSRTKRQVMLTDAGRSFLEGARSALLQAARAIDQARRATHGEEGTLSIGFAPSAEVALMPALVRAVARAHRAIRLDVRACSEHDALRAVQAGTLQAAVVPKPTSTERDVRVELLASRRLRAVVPAGHALARRPRVERQAARRRVGRAVHPRRLARPPRRGRGDVPGRRGSAPRPTRSEPPAHLSRAGGRRPRRDAAAGCAGPRRVACRPLEPPVASLDFAIAYREDLSAGALQDFLRTSRVALGATE